MAASTISKILLDKLAIREVIENWALYRDSGDWERFRSVWHDDGYMMATWFQGTHEEFAAISKAGMEKGVNILHFLGGCTIDIARNRAIAQTKMSIAQRAPVEGVLCDVTCVGRFYDFLEERNGKWAIVLRRLFYEKDRIDPVDPSQTLKLDPAILRRYPVGYQHLAYLQAGLGFPVKTNMPGLRGPDADRLYSLGRAWLDQETPDQKPMDESFRI
jgi:SnoaL-like domain